MVKIGFFLEDQFINGVDLSHPEKGNPGIGGTEYMFLLVPYYLKGYKKFEITYFNYNRSNVSILGCNTITCTNEEGILNRAKNSHVDILIFNPKGKGKKFYQELKEMSFNAVAWCHNFLSVQDAAYLADCEPVKRVVFVGKQQYDRYIDHRIIKKSTYIYNMVECCLPSENLRRDYKPWVTYVGSLTKEKGFDRLAKIWKNVIDNVPEAELHVIGSGRLYNKDQKLGKYGFTNEEYENIFMKYLTTADGKILPSVHFHGLLGDEKNAIFRETAVGVINPTAFSETFGIGAVEMNACGVPVVTKKKFGLMDTTCDGHTGMLFSSDSQFSKQVIELLVNHERNKQYGSNAVNFVKENFAPNIIVAEWEKMINELLNGQEAAYIHPTNYYLIDNKWIRICIHFFQQCSLFEKLPSLMDFKYLVKTRRIIDTSFLH